MHHIIIGGSIAGISAAKSIRGSDVDAEITIISEEKTDAYYRPMIPFLIDREEIDIRFEQNLFEKFRITPIYDKATGLDLETKEVILASDKRHAFERLLIATGSSPIIPQIKGLEGSGVFTLRTLDDALGIKYYAAGKKEAIVLGGGLVGIKAATALKHIGLNVTIIEKLPQILYQRIDKRGAQIILKAIRDKGIDVITGDTISEIIRRDDTIDSARLSTGKSIKVDIVIIAAGVKPNVDFLKDTGIKINKGVVIYESLQTSIPDVFAAGDVVEYTDLVTDEPTVSALWTNAEEMGKIAGKNMAGASIKYRGFLSVMNATEIFGIPFVSVGLIDPEDKEFEIITDDRIGVYRKLVFKDDTLVGAIFTGEISNAGIYTYLIKNRIPVGKLKEEAVKGRLEYIDFLRTAPTKVITM